MLRVIVLYDGAHFIRGRTYFRHYMGQGWIDLSELHRFLSTEAANRIGTSPKLTKIVQAHFYDGRASTRAVNGRSLEKERRFEMELLKTGIVPHYLPLIEKAKPATHPGDQAYELSQKGVDVALAVDAVRFACEDRCDACVLVAGDGDFAPLARVLSGLGKPTMVAHFSYPEWIDGRGIKHGRMYASTELLEAATWSLDLVAAANDPNLGEKIASLFSKPNGDGLVRRTGSVA
ncbi:MAG: NYN domain-containing protein [Phycisphaerae bacterium]